jgi:hypothetical protein
MKCSQVLTLGGATVALALAPTAALAAGGTTVVNVRVEGTARTLLASTNVQTHTGSITQGGTPAGTCPATSGAGALDVATHHKWVGAYSSSLGLSVTSILGESHPFTSSDYWSIWVDNKFAPSGVCGLKLHRGEQLLFAAVPQKGNEFPIVLTGPSHATAGHPFKVKATYYNAKGVAKPLAKAHLTTGSVKLTTSHNGTASIVTTKSGPVKIRATSKGFIRSATLSVGVAK